MDAIVLAGGRIQGEAAAKEGETAKALLRINGRSLLEHVVAALRGSRWVDRICVVGRRDVKATALGAGADLFAIGGETGIDNLMCGIEELGSQGRILCCASDLPFLTADDIDDLVGRTPAEAEVGYVALGRPECEAAFPASHASFKPFSDGEFTAGCVAILDSTLLKRVEPLVQLAFEARKSPMGMARLFGVGLSLRFLLGRTVHRLLGPSTEAFRRRAEAILGCRCAVIRGCSPNLALDVDDLDDWRYVRQEALRCA